MKTGIAIIAGLLISDGLAGGFDLNLGGCGLNSYDNSFACDCQGGSGNYDWNYSNLPNGWSSQGNKVFIPKGKYDDNKVYGAKVDVHDKKTQQSFQKSLFFSFKNGKVNKIAEHKSDFDPQYLIPGKYSQNDKNDKDYDGWTQDVRAIFDNSYGVGGGNGLDSIVPYYGGSGLYRGDDYNPYLWNLPADKDFDDHVSSGNSRGIRDLIVNGCQSKADPKTIFNFVDKIDNRFRNKNFKFNDDD